MGYKHQTYKQSGKMDMLQNIMASFILIIPIRTKEGAADSVVVISEEKL